MGFHVGLANSILPMWGLIVVKAYEATLGVARVSDRKRVDLPALGMPTNPISAKSLT